LFWLGPPIVAGAVASYFALRRALPISALNRGLYITWGLGIVLGFSVGIGADMWQPSMVPSFFIAVVGQAVISFIAGVVVGGLCALCVRRRNALRGVSSA